MIINLLLLSITFLIKEPSAPSFCTLIDIKADVYRKGSKPRAMTYEK